MLPAHSLSVILEKRKGSGMRAKWYPVLEATVMPSTTLSPSHLFAVFSYVVSALSEERLDWVVDGGVNLFEAGSRNICIALQSMTAPFLC